MILWVRTRTCSATATARDKSFNVDLAAGKSARMVVRKPGLISYFAATIPG